MRKEDWEKPYVRSLGFLLGGDAIASLDDEGQRIVGDTVLVLMNAHHEPMTLPAARHRVGRGLGAGGGHGGARGRRPTRTPPRVGKVQVAGRSMVVLRRPATDVVTSAQNPVQVSTERTPGGRVGCSALNQGTVP